MDRRGRVLVVDDEANVRAGLAALLRDEGYEVETGADAFKAIGKLEAFGPQVVLTDLKMPGMNGIELMRRVHQVDERCAVILMTAFGEVETAVEAMRLGAVDYFIKPVNLDELLEIVDRARGTWMARAESHAASEKRPRKRRFGSVIGDSPSLRKCYDVIEEVAPSRASVLIMGETGVGKELAAAAIHELSPRAAGPFVRLHCAALAENLLESELFGHERGAFTGAVSRRDGRLQMADGGTLFLDEIGEISPAVQVKLLRFLQEHQFERVGSTHTIEVDVRIVSATNVDLDEEIRSGRFRKDLFYRLNVVSVEIPPLRERVRDIPMLAEHFRERYARESDKQILGFTPDALSALCEHDWPGNVRELENVVERAVVLAHGTSLGLEQLPDAFVLGNAGQVAAPPAVPGASLAEIEKYAIIRTLEATGGVTTAAAGILGISRRKIQYKLQEYAAAPKSHVAAVNGSDARGKAR